MKNYTQSPLPFQGQKRRFLTPFKDYLNGVVFLIKNLVSLRLFFLHLVSPIMDSLIIDKKQVNIPANYTAYDDDIFSDKKMVFEEDYPNVEVVRNANITQPYLIIKKYAEGYNKPLELNVPVEVIGNKILLPNFVSYPYQYRFRHYSVDYELVVPKDMKVAKGNEHLRSEEHNV